jgi:GIY-YIG catalytic domain/NUMOD1 domain
MINKLYPELEKARLELKPYIENKAGIYQLVNLKNGKTYVGSSNNLYRRLTDYLNPSGIAKTLTRGKSHIMKALLKNGYTNFGIKILEFIDLDPNFTSLEKTNIIFKREQYHMDLIKPEYNIVRIINDGLGRHYPEETKLKMRISNATSKKIYAYNKDGSFYKNFSSMLEAGNELDINRRAIASRLKNINQEPSAAVHLFNKTRTISYILSFTPLTKIELDTFILSSKGLVVASSQKTKGHNLEKKICSYTLDGNLINTYDSLSQAGKAFKVSPATIKKYAQLTLTFKGVKLSFKT